MAKLLLVEDSAVLRMLIVDIMGEEGYEIDIACDGVEAVDLIKQFNYDLIILDNMMPRMSGFEVISTVRNMPAKMDVKILMLSAKSGEAEKSLALDAGADSFMSKPFSPIELANRVAEMIGR